MSQFLLDISVNMYEVIAMFALMLAIFRFSIKGYLTYTFIAAAVMAQTSYLLRFVLDMDSVTPFFMLLWFIIFAWLIFRIHIFYALLMVITGYLVYILVQSTIVLLLQSVFTLEELSGTLLNAKLIQVVGSTLTLAIALWLLRKRIGFSFVPDRMDEKVTMDKLNIALLVISIVSCLFISGFVFVFLKLSFLHSTLTASCLLCFLAILIILKIAHKKEMIT
ncbi:hypothetical protein [Cohnella sp. WQ 127256]|uniref:hypothetical protein n=1 Tax=Cohnella sp. WQ 127256 TaxID=2938790 RepID=UPI0021176FA4|nr:hypothetical protein [Cohnella sp. WQ 127256]